MQKQEKGLSCQNKKHHLAYIKTNQMMHRIFASRAYYTLVSLALSWTVTAKAE